MNMHIVIVFNLKWKGVWRTCLEERSPCARCRNKGYLLNSIHCTVRLLLDLQINLLRTFGFRNVRGGWRSPRRSEIPLQNYRSRYMLVSWLPPLLKRLFSMGTSWRAAVSQEGPTEKLLVSKLLWSPLHLSPPLHVVLFLMLRWWGNSSWNKFR